MGWTLATAWSSGRRSEVETFSGSGLPTVFGGSNTNSTGIVRTDVDAERTLVTDQAGKRRISKTNALGQLKEVWEILAASETGSESVSFPNTSIAHGFKTTYSYDTLGKMVRVQQGDQNRYFMYDSLGRMLRVKQPEQDVNTGLNTSGNPDNNSWTAGFTYDNNGNVLTATDAKGTTITNVYDALSRVTQRSYNDSPQTPTVNFYYDGTGLPSVPDFSKGKLTKVSSSVSESRYTEFDVAGRLLEYKQITDGQTYTSEYEYNLSGALVKETYPSGREIRNEFDPSGDIERIFGIANPSVAERTYANSFSYFADGRIEKLKLGNGLWESAKINSRGQVTEFLLGHGVSSGDVWKNTYEYGELSGGIVDATKNSGNIAKQTITFNGLANPLVQTYQYDSLYRLTEAKETSNASQVWKQNFTYDRYGNRLTHEKWLQTTQQSLTAAEHPTIDATNNRLSSGQGYVFDANGNMIVDADGRQFTFNSDNKQTQVKDAQNNVIGTYYFDGEGKRIKKVVGNDTTVFVYSGNKLIAEYSTETPASNPTTNWTVTDQLGSPRVIVNAIGAVVSRRDFMPFGEELDADETYRKSADEYGQTDSVRQKFTSYQKDEETGLDFAEARMYQNLHGRFTAIDPLLASGKSTDPQTFNRYVYVMNCPLILTDPTGLQSGTKPKKDEEPIVINTQLSRTSPRIIRDSIKVTPSETTATGAVPVGATVTIEYSYVINKPENGQDPGDAGRISGVDKDTSVVRNGQVIARDAQPTTSGGTFANLDGLKAVGKPDVKPVGLKNDEVQVTKKETFEVIGVRGMKQNDEYGVNFQITVTDPRADLTPNSDRKQSVDSGQAPNPAIFTTRPNDRRAGIERNPRLEIEIQYKTGRTIQ